MPNIYVDTDTLIETLEEEGYIVKHSSDDSDDLHEDVIYSLYRDWISLDGKEFEKRLKQFFEDYTGKLVV